MENKIVVGLDIGTKKICGVIGKKNEDNKIEIIEIINLESIGVYNGVITNINKAVECIKKAIEQLSNKADIDIKIININISGKHIKSEFRSGNIIREKIENEITHYDVMKLTNDMYKHVMPYGSIIIHVIPQYYIVDNDITIKDPIGMSGVKLESQFNIITGEKISIENIKKCIKKNNLEYENLFINAMASSAAVLSNEEKEAGVCLIDIGAGIIDIAIFENSVLKYTSVLPYGGDLITHDIKQAFSITEQQAELLKIKFGNAIADNNSNHKIIEVPGLKNRPPKEISTFSLAKIVEARVEEFIDLISSNIENHISKLGNGIILTGGVAATPNISHFFEYTMRFETRIGIPNENISVENININDPKYSTAIGLVLLGFQNENMTFSKISVNDYNKSKSKKKKDFFRRIFEKTKGLLIDDYLE